MCSVERGRTRDATTTRKDQADVGDLWLPPETMGMSKSVLLPRAMSGSRVLLKPGSVLMPMAQVAAGS